MIFKPHLKLLKAAVSVVTERLLKPHRKLLKADFSVLSSYLLLLCQSTLLILGCPYYHYVNRY